MCVVSVDARICECLSKHTCMSGCACAGAIAYLRARVPVCASVCDSCTNMHACGAAAVRRKERSKAWRSPRKHELGKRLLRSEVLRVLIWSSCKFQTELHPSLGLLAEGLNAGD